MACEHKQFAANVDVHRLEDSGGFIADVRIKCADCDLPFSFIGFPGGVSFNRPMVSIDATELHAPLEPGPQPLNTSMGFEMPARSRES